MSPDLPYSYSLSVFAQRIRILYLWAFLACPYLAAQPQLSSDEAIEFDAQTQSLVARGEATLTDGDLVIVADRIRYFQKQKQARAEGNVRLTRGRFRLVGNGLDYKLDEGRFESEAFRLGIPPIFAAGAGLSGTVEKVTLKETTVYFQEPGPFVPNLSAKTVTLYNGDRIEAEKVTFRIGKTPVFYLPRYSRPLGSSALKLKVGAGYRGNLGAYFRSDILAYAAHGLQLGGNLDAYSERGVLIGPGFHWLSQKNDHRVSSKLNAGFIDDHGTRGIDTLGRPIPGNRYFADFSHDQQIGENIRLTARISAWSDSEVVRDFRPSLFHSNQQPDNFIEAVYTGKIFVASAFLRLSPNDFQLIQERLPEIRIEMLPSKFFHTGLYHGFQASAVRLEEDSWDGLPGRKSDRIDFLYTLQQPLKINSWIDFTPRAALRLTYYDDSLGNRGSFSRLMGEIGFDLRGIAHASWNLQNDFWGIDGLRHIIRPVLKYRYHPEGKHGRADIVPIDRRVFSPTAPPIDLSDIRHIDDLTDLHVLRFGLENLLQTRRDDYGSRDLLELNFYHDLLLSATPGEDEWSASYIQLSARPASWLSLDLYTFINPEQLTLREARVRLRLTDGEKWSLTFRTDYRQREFDHYSIEYFYRINPWFGLRTRLRYDSRRQDFIEQVYGLSHRLGNSWEIEYQVAFRSGSTREDDTSFNIRLNLLQF